MSAFLQRRIGVALAVLLLGASSLADAQNDPHPHSAESARGAYLAALGDCSSCHTNGSDPAYAGGLGIRSPFGMIYASNITPDADTGIGRYSFDDFKRALQKGVAPGGKHLYPAMPYASFMAASDADLHDLYAYFMQDVAPVHHQPEKTLLPFPFSQRWALAAWNLVFARHQHYQVDPGHDQQWNRGAYLVQSFGHCGACHTTRGLAYEERGYDANASHFLGGSVLDSWFAGNLREDDATGLKRWSAADIAGFRATGHSGNKMVFGNMTEVIENSTQYLTDADRAAIAAYLKSIRAGGESSSFRPDVTSVSPVAGTTVSGELPGAGLYQNFCADCHGENGQGKGDQAPALAGNSMVMSSNPVSVIRIILEGGRTAKTQPKYVVMPHFAHRLTDAEVADVLNYLRASWGNHALAVPTRAVTGLRKAREE